MAVQEPVRTVEDSTDSDDSIKERRPQFSDVMRKDQNVENKRGHKSQQRTIRTEDTERSAVQTCVTRRDLGEWPHFTEFRANIHFALLFVPVKIWTSWMDLPAEFTNTELCGSAQLTKDCRKVDCQNWLSFQVCDDTRVRTSLKKLKKI
ncbi:hypothetical protein AOLI_G00319720 [Acnodon oligacanthus]